jgi:excinuclease ABC subunit C
MHSRNSKIEEKLTTLPQSTGIYKFLDSRGEILYVGKALNLRNRVKSYFQGNILDRPRIRQMMPSVQDLEIVETNNEIESLVLEAALIKEYKPKYNSSLKDDKSYSYIFVTTKDEFPTVKIVRNISSDELKQGEIFGPYPNSNATKRIFTYLRKLYPFCTSCNPKEKRESLYYFLGLCPGPYHGHISKKEYRDNINEIIKFLKGRKKGQISELEREMKEYSKKEDYEQAAILRDKIRDLKYLGEKTDLEYGESGSKYISKRKEMLRENFREIGIELGIKNLRRIECYDISNIQGNNAYGSMVVGQDGEIRRDLYRIFKIKGQDTPNDPEMLREVLQRRFAQLERSLTDDEESFNIKPDIVLIDGGKSQLGVVKKSVPRDILIIGISKGKRLRRQGKKLLDEFWVLQEGKAVKIDIQNSNILINLRDEAHRFAITHHRKARIRTSKYSELDKIPGVGIKRRKDLLRTFKSLKGIKKATAQDIQKVINNKSVTENICKEFNILMYPEE